MTILRLAQQGFKPSLRAPALCPGCQSAARIRCEPRKRGIRPSIPQREWPGRGRMPGRPPKVPAASAARWIGERTHAWMDDGRRLVVRWQRRVHNYLAFVVIACLMTCLRAISGSLPE